MSESAETFVKKALTDTGDEFELLVRALENEATSNNELALILEALSNKATLIQVPNSRSSKKQSTRKLPEIGDGQHGPLLSCFFGKYGARWLQEEELEGSFRNLLLALCSFDASFVDRVVSLLCQCFKTAAAEKLEHVHTTMAQVLRQSPTAVSPLTFHLSKLFPHHHSPKSLVLTYTQNCFTLLSYCPALTATVIEATVRRQIDLDVGIKLDRFDGDLTAVDETLFDLEDVHLASTDKANLAVVKAERERMEEMADKLDCLMLTLFEFIDGVMTGKNGCVKEETVFRELLNQFDEVISRTHRSKYTQFSLFVMCARKPVFAHRFLNLLHVSLDNPAAPTQHRATMAAYLASFVARCSSLAVQDIFTSFSHLVSWLHDYHSEKSAVSNFYPTLEANGMFYSVCQAMMYAFCYHHVIFTDPPKEVTRELGVPSERCAFLAECRFPHLLGAPFFPLQVCLPDVVEEFANVARPLGLLPLQRQTSLERNASNLRTKLGGTGTAAHVSGTEGLIDLFFPFDAFPLRRSHMFVLPHFRKWEPSDADDKGDNSDDSDDDESESDEEGDGGHMCMSVPSTMAFSPDCEDVMAHMERMVGHS